MGRNYAYPPGICGPFVRLPLLLVLLFMFVLLRDFFILVEDGILGGVLVIRV